MKRGHQSLPKLDIKTLSLDAILRQATDDTVSRAAAAWGVLGMLARNGRTEATVFLLGLMQMHRDDLISMAKLIDAISGVPSRIAAEAVKSEFYRIPSTASSRTYHYEILRALRRFPPPLALEALEDLARDTNLSIRWRRRIQEETYRLGA